MKDERDICPLYGSEMTDKIIDYSNWNDGHLPVVRSPRCELVGGIAERLD
jgi:hypothetical protein